MCFEQVGSKQGRSHVPSYSFGTMSASEANSVQVSMPWCDTHLSVNINTGKTVLSSTESQNKAEKLAMFKNAPYTSEEIWLALGHMHYDDRWELRKALSKADEHWVGNDVLINIAIHYPEEIEDWLEWMQQIHDKAAGTIMGLSRAAHDWLHAVRIDETEKKLRMTWAAAIRYEKNCRIFDCTSKGSTLEQSIREHRETRNHTRNVMQTIIRGVKNQLNKRGKENHERAAREAIQRDDATRRRMQEEQQRRCWRKPKLKLSPARRYLIFQMEEKQRGC